jgi:SAM-dependent methyltransferase
MVACAVLASLYELAIGDVAPRVLHKLKTLRPGPLRCVVPIRDQTGAPAGAVDSFWSEHPVNAIKFVAAAESLDYLDWRFRHYPLFRELMGLYGSHDDLVVLDYGCGPGNDLVGYLVYSNARRVIGIDVSLPALRLASHRLGLHRDHGLDRLELIHKSDRDPAIPLADASVDHVYCEGVLQHTSDPGAVLAELARVLRPGGTASLMVYNRESVWKHLYVAYQVRILKGKYRELGLEEAFSKTTDGEDCPLARSWSPDEFVPLCRGSGFAEATFAGGYLSRLELRCLARHLERALGEPRLELASRAFLAALDHDNRGYPRHAGHYAGNGGVYHLTR